MTAFASSGVTFPITTMVARSGRKDVLVVILDVLQSSATDTVAGVACRKLGSSLGKSAEFSAWWVRKSGLLQLARHLRGQAAAARF